MKVKSYFQNISQEIIREIQNAQRNISVAVAWITDLNIIEQLIEKAKENVAIEIILINDEINQKCLHHFNRLTAFGAKIFWIDSSSKGGIIHHKFCIIDNQVLINGSYNWTNYAKSNNENVIIHWFEEDEENELITTYNNEFDRILSDIGIITENERWGQAIKSWEENSFHQNELGKIYQSKLSDAIDCASSDPESAIQLMDECYKIVKQIGSSLDLRQFIETRSLIYRIAGKYLEAFQDLFEWLKLIPSEKIEEVERFKQTYEDLQKSYRLAAFETSFPVLDSINSLTKENYTRLTIIHDIPAHYFKEKELDVF